MRFAGTKNNRIVIVSDKKFENNNYKIIKVPEDLNEISDIDLLSNYKVHNDEIVAKHSKKNINELKLAFIGNWKMKCGISTYSENLLPHIIKHFKDVKLFIEENEHITSDLYTVGDKKISQDKVVTCWKRGESLLKLVKEIKDYNPDIILIQHEFGLWHNARYWLSFMNQISEYKTFVTMHSVFYHKDKTICEAAMQNIIVHLDGAKNVLKNEKGVPGNVYVIPHGCSKPSVDRLWNFYKSDHTFMQFGFGFRYKGWENCIKAASLLKEKYNDVFFTGLFSESPFNKQDHEIYYNDLMDLVKQYSLEENVAIIRGYQSDESLDSYLRTNQVAIFPYTSHPEHEVFGASGAARMAMSKSLPVITSSINHFSDLNTIKANSAEEIAKELDVLFSNKKAAEQQVVKQLEYLNDNTWEKVALKYINIFKGVI